MTIMGDMEMGNSQLFTITSSEIFKDDSPPALFYTSVFHESALSPSVTCSLGTCQNLLFFSFYFLHVRKT